MISELGATSKKDMRVVIRSVQSACAGVSLEISIYLGRVDTNEKHFADECECYELP